MTVEELLGSLEAIPEPKDRLKHVLDVIANDLKAFADDMEDSSHRIVEIGNFPGGTEQAAARLHEQAIGIEVASLHVREWIEHDWERGGEGREDDDG
jgi:pyruvate-formate lyase-activating enzyme